MTGCGKQRFATGAQARAALARIRKHGDRGPDGHKPSRPYACPFCRGWHLTSDPEKR